MGDYIFSKLDAATDYFIKTAVDDGTTEDDYYRFQQAASGKLEWGSGSAAVDTNLYRSAANTLATDDTFDAIGGLKIASTALTATATEINRVCDASARIVNLTAASLAVTEATHDGKIITIDKADGTAITLPAATGSGAKFEFFVGTTITSNSTTIKVANASDTMVGGVLILQDAGSTLAAFEASGTDDTITLNGSTTAGIKGDRFILTDVAANLWMVWGTVSGTGTEATVFSATV